MTVFGSGKLTDAYYAAFRLINLFRKTLGEGAVNAAVIPMLQEKRKNAKTNIQEFFNSFFILLTFASLIISVLGIIFRKEVVKMASYGFLYDKLQYDLTSLIAGFLLAQIVFIGMSSFFQCILNAERKFFVPALGPAVFSGILIIYLLLLKFGFLSDLSGRMKITILAALATVSASMQTAFLLFFFKRSGFTLKFSNPFKNRKVHFVLLLILPALLASAQDQILMFTNTLFASFMEPGSITSLYNSYRIINLPIALFAMAASQTAFVELSKSFSAHNPHQFNRIFNEALRINSAILIPASFGIMAISLLITQALFQHGKFTFHESFTTAKTLFFFSFGIIGFGICKIANAACFSSGKISLIIKISLLLIFMNVLLCMAFANKGAWGLALATSTSCLFSASVYLLTLHRHFGKILNNETLIFTLKSFMASVIMGLAAFILSKILFGISAVLSVSIIIPFSITLYFLTMKALKADLAFFLWSKNED